MKAIVMTLLPEEWATGYEACELCTDPVIGYTNSGCNNYVLGGNTQIDDDRQRP
jgi:hypothetical protein